MMYDHDRKLFTTPTMQATITKLSFVARQGKYAVIAGAEPQPQLRVSADNFVRLMNDNFTSGPTDVVTVWPPKDLLPDILQTATSIFNAKSVKRKRTTNPKGDSKERKGKKKAHTPVDQGRPSKRRPGNERSYSMEDSLEQINSSAPLKWLGYYDWTDLDEGNHGESSSSAARRLDDRERTAKKISDANTEIIDLTTSD